MVFTSHAPEKEFVFKLIEHAAYINAWIKSPDKNFYSIDYEYWKDKDRVRRGFNPDFFIQIRIEDYIKTLEDKGRTENIESLNNLMDTYLVETIIKVVEIKSNDDQDEATPAKAEYGKAHFEAVNKKLQTVADGDIQQAYRKDWRPYYTFDLLKPAAFAAWFERLKKGMI
jgi:hypothetical protein